MARKYLFWDFDGVIADSLQECLLVSYNAFSQLTNQQYFQEVYKVEDVPEKIRQEFKRTRGYVRPAQEYCVLFQAMVDGVQINSQNDFEKALLKYKSMVLRFGDLFYDTRKKIMIADPEYWGSLNKVYPWVLESWGRLSEHFDYFIVSNKDAESIVLILSQNQMAMDESKIFGKDFSLSKKQIINHLLRNGSVNAADVLFIDDNYNHLLDVKELGVNLYFANWGYGKIEGKENKDINVLDPNDFRIKLEESYERAVC